MLEKDLKKITEGVYPFHMPGHKRQKEWLDGLYNLDITEISGADDLHEPSGIIAEAQRKAAKLYGSVSTIFLSGGSTCGILSAISAVTQENRKIVIGRNCHKSVYNACFINGLEVNFAYPALRPRLAVYGETTASEVAAALEKSGAKTVVVTSPTYEGVVSDIKSIAKVVHKAGGILIVDSAHGAHLGLCDYFPQSARNLGADIVVESAHKTLPCLTGAALLHICSHRVSYADVQRQLGLFETSSPSYPTVCSIDRALSRLCDGKLFADYITRLDSFYEKCKELKHLSLFESGDFDRSKLVIYCGEANISGFELKKMLLDNFKIETEMAMPNYTLAMTSVADTDEGFNRLFAALKEIDSSLCKKTNPVLHLPPKAKTIKSMNLKSAVTLTSCQKAVGQVSAEFIYAYPPGSPIIAPGEELSAELLEYVKHLYATGAQIHSTIGKFPDFIAISQEKDC